jgi:hypothetical protein
MKWEVFKDTGSNNRNANKYSGYDQVPAIIVAPLESTQPGTIRLSQKAYALLGHPDYVHLLTGENGSIGICRCQKNDEDAHMVASGRHAKKNGNAVNICCKGFVVAQNLARPNKIAIWRGSMLENILVFSVNGTPLDTIEYRLKRRKA